MSQENVETIPGPLVGLVPADKRLVLAAGARQGIQEPDDGAAVSESESGSHL